MNTATSENSARQSAAMHDVSALLSSSPLNGQDGNFCTIFTRLYGELPRKYGQTPKNQEKCAKLHNCPLTGQRSLAKLRCTKNSARLSPNRRIRRTEKDTLKSSSQEVGLSDSAAPRLGRECTERTDRCATPSSTQRKRLVQNTIDRQLSETAIMTCKILQATTNRTALTRKSPSRSDSHCGHHANDGAKKCGTRRRIVVCR